MSIKKTTISGKRKGGRGPSDLIKINCLPYESSRIMRSNEPYVMHYIFASSICIAMHCIALHACYSPKAPPNRYLE